MNGVSLDYEDLDIYTLARVPRSQTELLPDTGGLYFALDGAERVWYIGQATSLRSRLSTHDKSVQFLECGVQFFAWKEVEGKDQRNELERFLMERFSPPLNQLLIPKTKPFVNLGMSPEEEIARYVELKRQVNAIEFELNMLKANIVSRCEDCGGKIKLPEYQVFLSNRKSWKFSETVYNLEAQLKGIRKKEQDDGTATIESTSTFPVVKTTAKGMV